MHFQESPPSSHFPGVMTNLSSSPCAKTHENSIKLEMPSWRCHEYSQGAQHSTLNTVSNWITSSVLSACQVHEEWTRWGWPLIVNPFHQSAVHPRVRREAVHRWNLWNFPGLKSEIWIRGRTEAGGLQIDETTRPSPHLSSANFGDLKNEHYAQRSSK